MSAMKKHQPKSNLAHWLARAAVTVALAVGGTAQAGGAPGALATASDPLQMDGMFNTAAPDPHQIQIKELAQSGQARIVPYAIDLPLLAAEKAAAVLQPSDSIGPQQIGLGRDVAQTRTVADTVAVLHWSRTVQGAHRAAVSVYSPDAKGLRLALQVEQMPPATVLRVYASGSEDMVEIAGPEVLRTIQRNLDAGTPDAEARIYWLPTVMGHEGVLEIELPLGVDPAWLEVSIPQISHLVALPTDDEVLLKASGYCNIDIMCTAQRDGQSHAVARMTYVKGGSSYLCTGTLLNNTGQDFTPYFLSANHCISTQAPASTLETYWNYRASSCNSGERDPTMVRVMGGAQLLSASAATDTSFMRINGALPSSVLFAGWNANPASGWGSVYGIHHPRGDLQKFSEGALAGFFSCVPSSGDTMRCSPADSRTGAYLVTQWSRGTVEGGSSGSALFESAGRVIGQLYGGSSSCTNPGGQDVYGRLDLAFDEALHRWLSPSGGNTPPPAPAPVKRSAVYRFYNTATDAHFYTNSELERDYVIENLKELSYEGPTFYASSTAAPGTSPVYRFHNTKTGVHFYTISKPERDLVISELPHYTYEGPSWYARASAGDGSAPMYRFYNAQRQAHFYTINAAEADHVRQNLPEFSAEGIAYYGWTTP